MANNTESPPTESQTEHSTTESSKKSSISRTLLLGLVSLATIILCAAASAIVVGVSNDTEVETWKISPAVWLAIFSAASNVAFGSALTTGIAVRFWLEASRGTQLSQLHYIWDHGRGFGMVAALRAGSAARVVTILATIAYVVQFSCGPLLQRSTRQANHLRYTEQTMFINLANRIPDGWLGSNENGSITHGRKAMSQAQQWYLNSSIVQPESDGYRCEGGTCLGRVRGAGFTHSCKSSTQPLDMSNNASAHLATVFLIDAKRTLNHTGHTILQLNFSHVSTVEGNCQATINTTVCDVSAAVVEYPVAITNSTLSLRHADLSSSLQPLSIVESDGDGLGAPNGVGVGPLAGLGKFVDNYFFDNATIRFNNKSNRWLYSGPGPGALADIFFQAEPWDYSNHSLETCGLFWASPTQYVLTAMHEYMFRVAMRVGVDAERQSFVAEKSVSVLVFKSDWRYLSAALAVILAGLCMVGWLSWGGWRLKRAVTLSPLETAALFVNLDAKEQGSNALREVLRPGVTVDQILTDARRMDVHVVEGKSSSISRVRSTDIGQPRKRVVEPEITTLEEL